VAAAKGRAASEVGREAGSGASLLIDTRVNPKAIQEFMGHATIEETFSRHLMPGTRNHARELVDAYMDVAMAAERVPRLRHERR